MILLLLFMGFSVIASEAQEPCRIGVYAHDSFAGKGGLGPEIFSEFEHQTGCHVDVLASGNVEQVLGRVEIDAHRGKLAGDVLVGVDTLLWKRVFPLVKTDVVLSSQANKRLEPFIRQEIGRFSGLVPYDWGALALLVDQKKFHWVQSEISLRELNSVEWKKNFILEDPRTSSPGLQFLIFSHQILGSEFQSYWGKLKNQWLTMPAGWSAAYGMLLREAAPSVWTYVTSEADQREKSGDRYRALLFREGQPVQLEGAVVLKGAKNPEAGARFLEFLLSDFVQDRVGRTNWMWPVSQKAKVPESFRGLPRVEKKWILHGENSDEILKNWSEAIH
jgi:thiamine transport system substrate-binding protein